MTAPDAGWSVYIVRPGDWKYLVYAAQHGRDRPIWTFEAIMQSISIEHRDKYLKRSGSLCLLCDHEFCDEGWDAVAVIHGHDDDGPIGVAHELCAKCAELDDHTLFMKVSDVYDNAREIYDAVAEKQKTQRMMNELLYGRR